MNEIIKSDEFDPLVKYITAINLQTKHIEFELPYEFKFNVVLAMKYFMSGIVREMKYDYVKTSGTFRDEELLKYLLSKFGERTELSLLGDGTYVSVYATRISITLNPDFFIDL